jgi:exopolyphosphatase/guanosine-5'-triphosphate,3'-diphosphate pyrophosphatase
VRVAAIDQGTNTTRLLVAHVDGARVEEVHRESRITGLGEGVDARRRLLPLPIARVRNALTDYRRTAERLGAERSLLGATSAVRDAENGDAFLGEVEWSYGFGTRLVSGDEEAQLGFRGATLGRTLGGPTLTVDIGGGSTELVVGGADGPRSATSVDIGSVRMTERFFHADPPSAGELHACAEAVRGSLPEPVSVEGAIGVSATILTFAALDLGLAEFDRERVEGHRLTRAAVAEQLDRLAALSLEERRRVPALDPARAPVIVAGGVILREVLAHYGLDELETTERDILDGIALEAAELPAPVEGAAPPGAYTCC